MNNDELQKAIDDITNNNAVAEATPAADATAENEQLANELAAAAPETAAPEAPAGFAPAPAPAPEIPAEPGMPPVADEAVAPEMAEAVTPAAPAEATPEAPAAPVEVAPVAEEAPEVAAPAMPEIKLDNTVAAEAPAADEDTLNEAYKALYPLLDKVEMPVEEKFDITMKFGEPAKALELAKQIADDTSKANALMKIIEKLK